jgi:ppGpp synthetase/RelA/SpoT-type nucleotidyltranferase
MTAVDDEYRRRFEGHMERVAVNLQQLVLGHLGDAKDIDSVRTRAKDPTRFAQKAARLDEQGQAKYATPLTEIQDQIGVLVVVRYKATVDPVWDILARYLAPIEDTAIVPDSYWEFGYFGRHGVMALPLDTVPAEVGSGEVPGFFELQIKTLFQYAWSEANHDLGYKSSQPLSGDQKRLSAFAAAQAWGADRAFDELYEELVAVNK